MNFRTRIAPTPSGFLHSGNKFSFQLTAQLAKEIGADILLRIDDLDAARKRSEYVNNVFETLHQMEINWQLGPQTPDEFESQWSQHLRIDVYTAVLNELLQQPKRVYACACSRRDLASTNGLCHCKRKNLPLELPDVAWRVNVEPDTLISFKDIHRGDVTIDLAKATGDFVVRRRDGIPAYQVASLADDIHFGITHIVRGEDLLASTAAQLFLARILNYTAFLECSFLHHTLITDELGEKLSKSTQKNQFKP